jgi:hypothetical protein
MIKTGFGFVQEGYCEHDARANVRVFSLTNCSNKARYKVTLDNGRTINVCGTHLREYYQYDIWSEKPIKGKFIKMVTKVEDLKTGKVIYNKNYD